jgi:tetratricopeptide (TPR) repeat protein
MAAYAPYKYNPAEMPPEDLEAIFIGRWPLVDHLLSAVSEQADGKTIQHYLLLGPRGIGKTTLLLMLQRKIDADPLLSSHWLCVRYREEEFYVHTLRDLLALALENLHAEAHVSEAGAVLAEAEAHTEDEQSLATILSGLRRISESHGKRILLLIDNFDQVFPKRAGRDTGQAALRKLLSTEHFIMVIGTSVQLFEEIAPYDEAFFNFFSPIYVENLADDEIEALLSTRAKLDENKEFLKNYEENKEKVKAITFLTGGNPRLVLMLYDILSRKLFLPVVQTLRETMDNLTPLLKDVLQDLPAQQSKVLDTLMRLGGVASPSEIAKRARLPLNAVTTQLGRLKNGRFVEALGEGRGKPGTYRVRDQMFRTWYQMRYLRPARRRIEMFVEFLRAWFSVGERTSYLDEMKTELKDLLKAGRRRQVREVALGMEYIAASFMDSSKRTMELEHVADAYVAAGDFREAALTLADLHAESWQGQGKHEAFGYAALGRKLQEKDDVQRAVEAYQEAVKRDEDNVDAKLGLGICHLLRGQAERAVQELTAVCETKGIETHQLSSALANRARAKRELGDPDGAIADLTAVTELEGVPIRVLALTLIDRGKIRTEVGNVEGAIADFTAVTELENAPVELVANAFNWCGLQKYEAGDSGEAIANYSAVIALPEAAVEEVASALVFRGVTRGMLGDTKAAIADFTAVTELEKAPSEMLALALNTRGIARGEVDDHEGAIADFTAVTELQNVPVDELADALTRRGIARGELEDYKGAIEDFTAVTELEGVLPRELASAMNNRGVAKRGLGDSKGAIDDWTAVIELEHVDVEELAWALNTRGIARGEVDDHEGAIADFTAVTELQNVPVDELASALTRRGIANEELKHYGGAIEDFTAVTKVENLPIDELANALTRRGIARGELEDYKGAIEDFTAVTELEGVLPRELASAMNNRGAAKRGLGDSKGAIDDWTAVIELEHVHVEELAWALNTRAMARAGLDDLEGAIADFTAVTELESAPVQELSQALNNRAVLQRDHGDLRSAIAGFTALAELEDVPSFVTALAFNNRGRAREELGDVDGAINDYGSCIESGAHLAVVYDAVARLLTLLSAQNQTDAAAKWIARIGEIETEETSVEEQLEARLRIASEVARKCSADSAVSLLDTILDAADPPLRSRLMFLKPALEFARAGDESVLAKLPAEEQEIARRIAGEIGQPTDTE